MNLRLLAEQDLALTLEDSVTGFGWAVTVTDPAGASVDMTGQSHDVGLAIDPDTGIPISGRSCAVTLRTSSIVAAGIAVPNGRPDQSLRPYLVTFNDINGAPYKFKVVDSIPDRVLGIVTLILGGWDDE